MNRKSELAFADTDFRITSVLRSKEMRSALAEFLGTHELVSARVMAFPREGITEHLSMNQSQTDELAFYDAHPELEAIILITGRPVLLVQNGVIEEAELGEVEAMLKGIRDAMVEPISAVGRIELSDHDTYSWCGTGWRIEEDLIVTNRHVANIFAQRQEQTFKFRVNRLGKPVRARIDFREEFGGIESEEFGIAKILWIAEDTSLAPDIAILQIIKDPGLPPPLSLASKRIKRGQHIGVVGYPARDSRNDPGVMAEIFKNIYDVKRFAPGEVVWPGILTWFITHDASTSGGASGAAVIDLASQEVMGLHFGGSFRKANYAVKASVIKGILSRRTWNVVSHKSLKIPSEEFTEKKRTTTEMDDRMGYARKFLGKTVALPRVGKSHSVLKTDFQDEVLPYMHFSILMSNSRRFPIYTAENLDASLRIMLKRRDSWGYDPRIPTSAQVGHDEFYGPELFDKGHMVRRVNAGWGSSKEEAQLGEEDTFIYTNAVPQMPQLNQKTWLSLEDYILDNAKTEGFKICVFTGPIFRGDDPTYRNVQVPIDFWKIVVAIDADSKKLLASAYLLSQEGLMPEEGFQYGPFKTYQVPVKRIEKLADLKFSRAIRNADVFRKDEIAEMITTSRYIEINSADDIVLTSARN